MRGGVTTATGGEAVMNYQNDAQELARLFQDVEYIKGTFPPVYLVGDMLIGYDKLEQIRVIAVKNPPVPGDQCRENALRRWLSQLTGKSAAGYNMSSENP
jgi:hypothetical protein